MQGCLQIAIIGICDLQQHGIELPRFLTHFQQVECKGREHVLAPDRQHQPLTPLDTRLDRLHGPGNRLVVDHLLDQGNGRDQGDTTVQQGPQGTAETAHLQLLKNGAQEWDPQ